MTFGNYIYQDGTSQSRQAAIDQIINTADKLEAGHLKAVEAASQLKTTIANLDMNEAEDSFKAGLLADIEKTIDDNIQYGNMYYALDDIIKKSGDILSNPAVIGRLNAQRDYKTFLENLDKRNDIPEYLKNMYRDSNVNPYYYEDKIENDKIIGGSKWVPANNPVSHIDEIKIIEEALKLVKPDKNSKVGSYYFVDANNNKVDPLKGIGTTSNIFLYDHTTGSRIELTKEHIGEALSALYDANTSIRESNKQDMLYSMYTDGESRTNTDLYYQEGDKQGHPKSEKDYFMDKYGNSMVAFAFKQTASDHQWTVFNSAAGYNTGGGGGEIPNAGNVGVETYDEGTVRTEENDYSNAQGSYNNNIKTIEDYYNTIP